MNWPQIIEDIRTHGVNQATLAKMVGVSEETIGQLKRGLIREPKWGVGNAMLRIRDELLKTTEACSG
jgi:DNA-binding XRE family transcriptional regulator